MRDLVVRCGTRVTRDYEILIRGGKAMAVYRLDGHASIESTDEAGVVKIAEEYAEYLNRELEDGEAKHEVTDVASAIEVLEMVNIYPTLV